MIAIFSDIHFGIHGNSDDYFSVCEEFVDYFVKYLHDHDINKVIFAGDWFDSRNAINGKVLFGANRCLRKISSACEKFYMIVGNHDTYERSSIEPNSVEMYNGLKNVVVLSSPFGLDEGQKRILLVPWIVGGNASLDKGIYKDFSRAFDLVVGHFDFGAKFFQSSYETSNSLMKVDPFREETGFTGFIDRVLKKDGVAMTGHIHNRSEKTCAGRRMIIMGSPYETAAGFTTECGFYLYDETHGDISFVKNPRYPTHVVVKASEIRDGRIDVASLSGKVVSFEIDCKCTMEEAAGFQAQITQAKPFSYRQNSFSIQMTDEDKQKIENAGGNVSSKSKFDYVLDAINAIDEKTFDEDGISKDELIADAKRFFESSSEVVNKKNGVIA